MRGGGREGEQRIYSVKGVRGQRGMRGEWEVQVYGSTFSCLM